MNNDKIIRKYTTEEMILFSLIYSDIKNGRFPKPYLSHKLLYGIFHESLSSNTNFFNIETSELEKLFFKVIKKINIRNEEKYKEEFDFYFRNDNKRITYVRGRIAEELELCKINNIKYTTYFSDDYPISLKELEDPPFVIYYKGVLPNNYQLQKSLAVIGTRNPDEKYGREVAQKTGQMLSEEGWWNISGLALGCDEYGHRGSLLGKGLTGAILAHGLSQKIFPKENSELAEEILLKKGFLLSEIPPSIKINPLFLVLRDRLQSGMTKGIFVVETSEKSGTLHTVNYSLEQKKKVFVWDPSGIDNLKESKEISGNLILIGKKEGKLSPNISQKIRQGIKSISRLADIRKELQEIEKIEFNNKKEVSETENKSSSNFFQNKLEF